MSSVADQIAILKLLSDIIQLVNIAFDGEKRDRLEVNEKTLTCRAQEHLLYRFL